MQISFFIAQRYLKKQGKTTLIYRLSKLSCYSMGLGTAILIVVLATMNGMEKLLATLFYTYMPTLKIESKIGKTFVADKQLKEKIIDLSGVTAIVEVLEATALIRLQHQQALVTIKGVSPNFIASDFYKNCTRMDGVNFLAEGQPQAIAGIGLSQFLQWSTSKKTAKNKVTVFYPKSGIYHLHNPYKRFTLELGGFFSIAKKIDSRYMIMPLHFVEDLTDGLHKRTYWEVVIPDMADLESTQTNIQKLLPNGYKVINREEQNETRRRAIFIERLAVCFIFALVLLLASLHIFFMLCMLILHKQKDIHILVALGATPDQIGRVFFYNGLLVALKGILYGLVIGSTIAFLQQKFGIVTFTIGHAKVSYPIEMHGLDVLYTVIVTVLFSLLATLWPVKRAMQLARKSLSN
ncbi:MULTISPECIES: FtsX-like permease family protein [unclassified Candidatus Cardinium]|uniref:FtsX-like permease family protein n=1 Tax=unclassified Candidatus Cardinium TaxID=2641185 RepID=UPI001FB4055A|nr:MULTISPECIES: FtsX-like permease family protein [unclassified Candidatus Cardinium]